VSKLWSPYNLYNNIIGWWDSRDLFANNGLSYPIGSGTNDDVSLAKTDVIKDKSISRSDFTGESNALWDTLYYQINDVTVTNGGTAGAYGGVATGFLANIDTTHINQQAFNGDLVGGNWLAPRNRSFSPVGGFINANYSNDAITSVTSATRSRNWHIGDTFYADLGTGTSNNVILTVSSVREYGGLIGTATGTFSTAARSGFPSNFRLFVMCVLTDDGGISDLDEAFLEFVDQDGSNHIELIYEVQAGSLGKYTAKTAMKVKYKDSGGTDRESSGDSTVTPNQHTLFEFEFNSTSSFVSEFLNGTATDSTATTTAIQFPTNYKIKMGNGTRFEFFEMIMIDEDVRHLTLAERQLYHGYFAHKYDDTGLVLVDGHPYKTVAPAADGYLYGGAHKLNPREPLQMVKMYLDECDNVFGVVSGLSNCNATPSTGNECYNTKHTCLNLSKYRVNTNGKKELTFSQEVGNNLAGFEPTAHPALISVTSAPSEIQPTKGVSVRSNITIKLRDFISDDKGIDPYFSTRSIIALENGTFFQKLLARNPHYYGRPIEIYDGFFDYDGTPQVHDGKREYIIESIHLDNDICTIKCKDPMSLADDLKSKVPVPSDFSFKIDVTTGTKNNEVLTIDDADATAEQLQAEFGTSGFVRVNEEIMGYTRSAGDASMDFHESSRGDWGTTEASHSAGDTVQKCLAFGTYNDSATGSTIDDVAYEIFVNGAGVPAGAINKTTGGEYSWADEKTNWLSTFKINTIISEPEEANKLVNQLGSMVGTNFFYDDLASKIVMRAEMPIVNPLTIQTITDVDIVEDSLKIMNSEKDRISRVYYYYNRKNGVEDRNKKKSFRNLYVNIDVDSEGSEEYAKQSNKVIYGWGVIDSSTATSVSQRILNRFKNVPKTVSFKLDVGSKQIKTGDHFYLQTKSIVNLDGGITARTEMQCIYSKFNDKLQVYEIKAQQFRFTGANFGQVTANVLSITAAGSGYAVDNTMTFTGGSNSATGLTCKVTSVDGSNGVTGVEITAIGDLNTASKYVVGDVLTEGGGTNSGTGCQVTIGREYFLGEGAGTGTVEDPYTGARATESYICDDDLQMSNGSEPYRIV
jgi:hypothetical protein